MNLSGTPYCQVEVVEVKVIHSCHTDMESRYGMDNIMSVFIAGGGTESLSVVPVTSSDEDDK